MMYGVIIEMGDTEMTNQPLAEAFFKGRDAFLANQEITVNPFDGELAVQWERGFKNTRRNARFDATIKSRQERKKKGE